MQDAYIKVSDELRAGVWGREGKLPSVRQLARHYQCSLTVIQQAVKLLNDEGLIRSCHGKGTFWAGGGVLPNYRANKIIGVSYLNIFYQQELENLKREYLRRGWFVSGYNADEHFQDPAFERQFVLLAREQRFSGLVLLATPIAPVNTEVFTKMRIEGMKIAHLVPYCEDMSQEPLFCADYHAIGELAVEIALWGKYRYLQCWVDSESPDRRLTFDALRNRAREENVEILPDCRMPSWSQQRFDAYMNGRESEVPPIAGVLSELPPGTCIFAQSPALIDQVVQLLRKMGKNVPLDYGALALDGFRDGRHPVDSIAYDRLLQLQTAMDYVADESISPLEVVRKLYPPEWIRRGTII